MSEGLVSELGRQYQAEREAEAVLHRRNKAEAEAYAREGMARAGARGLRTLAACLPPDEALSYDARVALREAARSLASAR